MNGIGVREASDLGFAAQPWKEARRWLNSRPELSVEGVDDLLLLEAGA